MEYSVRGKTIEAYLDAARKVDRSMRGGAIAAGCGLTITTLPGNLPIVPVKDASVVGEALAEVCGDTPVTCTGPEFHSTSSGDYGDVSCLMPLLQFNTGSFHDGVECWSQVTGQGFKLSRDNQINKSH